MQLSLFDNPKEKLRASHGEDVVIYCDGACKGNGTDSGIASWAFVEMNQGKGTEVAHGKGLVPPNERQTSNTGELWAIREAVRHAGDRDCLIVSDSQYALNSLGKWGTRKKDKPNIEMIISIKSEIGENVRFKWVKGHSGVIGNELANDYAESMIR